MLIRKNGEYAGLISGGCLEADLIEHASLVFESGKPLQLTYDLSIDDEAIWGLGLGCGGAVHLLLQRLDADQEFGFLPALFDSTDRRDRRQACILALAHREIDDIPAGSWAIQSGRSKGLGNAFILGALKGGLDRWNGPGRFSYAGSEESVLLLKIEPPPRVLVCGAGPDAIPMARQVDALGWECIVVDHRSAFARPERFPASCRVLRLEAGQLQEQVELDRLSAAIVMSHNLEHDATYLQQLVSKNLAYLGLLGPKARRLQLQKDLNFEDRLIHGPVGFDIGAELPEAIALSVMAEIHAVLAGKLGSVDI